MAESSNSVVHRLKKAFDESGFTQSYLAGEVGTTQPAVSQWLSGVKNPSMENLADIEKVLGLRPGWLSTGTPPMKLTDQSADRQDYLGKTGWKFRLAPQDGGRDHGNSNVWTLDPGLDVLVREVLQNAGDAALSPDKKVEVAFRIITLSGTELSNFREALKWEKLRSHLDASTKGKQKFNTLLRDGLKQLDENDELLLLVIEDTGTTGLTGPEKDYGKECGNFTALCRNNLDSNKEAAGGSAGGAFGLGKAVLWRASRLSTVLFSSNLSKPEHGKSSHRLIGKCELAWHQTNEKSFAGPGWFGNVAEGEDATSFWENKTLAEDLYIAREGTGTTTCVIGFHDASADLGRKPIDLAKELVRVAAENFFPALATDKLGVNVEVYNSGGQYQDRKPSFSQAVNPEEYMPASVRMIKAYREDATLERLGGKKDEVVTREVSQTIPKRVAEPKHAEQEHKAVLLLTPVDEDGPRSESEKPNQLAMFRGPGMVVHTKSLAGVCLGARPFHALLLCGRAPGFVAPGLSRPNPQSDEASDMFLRTAEPPSHNQWTATPDLKAVYALGCKARLDAFLKAAAEAIRDLVKPLPKDTGDGPNSLKELFQIGSEPSSRSEQPRVVEQRGEVDADGRWRVTARIRLKARKTRQRLTPAVYFLAETGKSTPVSWESLKAEKGCEAMGMVLLVPPNTREIRFSGETDPNSHPIPAADSCVEVDIKKVVELNEVEP